MSPSDTERQPVMAPYNCFNTHVRSLVWSCLSCFLRIISYCSSSYIYFMSKNLCITGEKSEYMGGMIKIVSKRCHQNKWNIWSQSRKGNSYLHHWNFLCKSDRPSENSSKIFVDSEKSIYFPKLSHLPAIYIYDPTPKKMNKSTKDLSILFDVKVVHSIWCKIFCL